MSIELKKYKVIGFTTDFNKCDCCGKENLKGTVTIIDLDHDAVLHFGTTCAASTDKYDTLEAAREAKKEITKAVNSAKQAEQNLLIMAAHRCKAQRIKYGVESTEYKSAFIIACQQIKESNARHTEWMEKYKSMTEAEKTAQSGGTIDQWVAFKNKAA